MVTPPVYSEGLLWLKCPNKDASILTVTPNVYEMVENIIANDSAPQHFKAICFDKIDLLHGTTISAQLLTLNNEFIHVDYHTGSEYYNAMYMMLRIIKQCEFISSSTSSCQIFIFSHLIDGFNDGEDNDDQIMV